VTWVPTTTGDGVQELFFLFFLFGGLALTKSDEGRDERREWFGDSRNQKPTTHNTSNTLTPSVRPVMSQVQTPLWWAQPVRLEVGSRQESVRACQDPDGCWPETEVRRRVWVVVAFLDMKPKTSRGASYHPVANKITECDEGLPEPEGYSSSTPVRPSPCNRTCVNSLRCFRKATGSPLT